MGTDRMIKTENADKKCGFSYIKPLFVQRRVIADKKNMSTKEEIIATCSTIKPELVHSCCFLMPNCIIPLSCMNFVKCPLNFGGREGIENSATPTRVSELCRCFPLAMQPPTTAPRPALDSVQTETAAQTQNKVRFPALSCVQSLKSTLTTRALNI